MHEEVPVYTLVPSQFGEVSVVWRRGTSDPRVIEILLPRRKMRLAEMATRPSSHPSIDRLCEAIQDYMEGRDVDLPISWLDLDTCSQFQRTVLMAEKTIPRGRVAAYSELAAHIERPRAARAVGTALARNPFPIIIPCHRTVRSDGSLGGFGGGLDMKRALLAMEGVAFDDWGRVNPEFFWDWSAVP
jgi:methylated-DNA-[protein]-cysteine S-methyltransferase